MSEQIVDLRSVWAILRRHGRVLALAAVVGGAAGAGALQAMPSEYTSTTMLLFPAIPTGAEAPASAHAIDTQVQIATSDAVLGRAGQVLRPPVAAPDVADRVQVEGPTEDVLTITASGATPAEAEALASAVASSDVDYLGQAASGLSNDQRAAMAKRRSALTESLDAVGRELTDTSDRLHGETPDSAAAKTDAATLAQLTARQADLVLQVEALDKQLSSQATGSQASGLPRLLGPASPAQSQPAVVRGALFVGFGAAAALGLGAAFAILRGRREKALRSRDQIADSIGVPVVASVQTRTPRSVAGWVSLLRGYSPGSADAWALHQLLQRFTPDGGPGAQAGTARRGRSQQGGGHRSTRILVLSLEGDEPALSFGPQLASFTAGGGRPSRLVTSSQREDSTNSLLAACSRIGDHEQLRPGLVIDSPTPVVGRGELVVQCVSLSRQRPGSDIPQVDDAVTLLAVSSGGASAEEFARVALAADEAGVPLDGIVVTNPDHLDRTTGRLLPTERAVLAPLPSLMTGARKPDESGLPTALGRKR